MPMLQPDSCPTCKSPLPLDCARPRIATARFWVRSLCISMGVVGLQLISLALAELLSFKPVLDWMRQHQIVQCIPSLLIIAGIFLLAWLSRSAFAQTRKVTVTCPVCHSVETCSAMESPVVTKRLEALKKWAAL